jgi:retron-type reverse transcriptase
MRVKNKQFESGWVCEIDKYSLHKLNLDFLKKTSKDLKSQIFQFKPSKTIWAKNFNGEKYVLKIPTLQDKIVQESMRSILEIVFEPVFSEHSHGFRAGHCCMTAMTQVIKKHIGAKWFIKGNVSNCFSSLDHQILVTLVKARIKDSQFIDLLWKILKSGYLNFPATFKPSNFEISQVSLMSPILSNIYLDCLDSEITRVCTLFREGKIQYKDLYYKVAKESSSVNNFYNIGIKPKQLNIMDSSFKQISYVRYANKFLISVIGSKCDCNQIKNVFVSFLKEKLNFSLSNEDILITNATKDYNTFLGILIVQTPQKKVTGISNNNLLPYKTQVKAPILDIVVKLKNMGFCKLKNTDVKPTRVGKLIHLSKVQIIQYYLQTEKALLDYYQITTNYTRFAARIHYILKYSCILTLASKLNLKTKAKVIKRFGLSLTIKNAFGTTIAKYPTPRV